jgi:hypothetical protein
MEVMTMFGSSLQKHFGAIGARVRVVASGSRFEIDVVDDRRGERFDLRLPQQGSVTLRVDDVDRSGRQLVLAARGDDWSQKFLCGHDEHHWFVAALPLQQPVANVREAFEALKPSAVVEEQHRKRVRRRRQRLRKTAAYVRQGEWFFVPRPDAIVSAKQVRHNDVLVRDGGTPHQVEWLARMSGGVILARGEVSHPDHDTIRLDGWHQVFRNLETTNAAPVSARPMGRVATRSKRKWEVMFRD